jgi:hypothetical protein
MARVSVWRQIASSSCTQCGLRLLQKEAIYIPCVLSHGSSFMEAAECCPGRQLWTGMRISVTACLLQGPLITEYKSQCIECIEHIDGKPQGPAYGWLCMQALSSNISFTVTVTGCSHCHCHCHCHSCIVIILEMPMLQRRTVFTF